MLKYVILAGTALCLAAPASSAVVVSFGAAHAVNTAELGSFAVEDFERANPGFDQDYSEMLSDGHGHAVTFTYNDVAVRAHDQFAGDGTGNYGATYHGIGFNPHEGPTFSLDVSSTGGPINFFGAYFSATDTSNTIEFYKEGALITSIALGDLSPPFVNQGNFYANFAFTEGQTYDRVIFTQPVACCGFESDNHTVGTWGDIDDQIGTVPEPATWAMIVGGFGIMGAAMRRRRISLTFG